MGVFRISASNFEWIGGTNDDPQDLCLHGFVRAQFGETVLEQAGTVSATALYLLKTLTDDKIMSDHDIQMIPCCGHFFIAHEGLQEVTILGCDIGADWTTIHDGDTVCLRLPSGQEERVSLSDYRREVLMFADAVKHFYDSCSPKELPTDEFHRNGYLAFWNEWNWRYQKGSVTQ